MINRTIRPIAYKENDILFNLYKTVVRPRLDSISMKQSVCETGARS